MSVLLLLPCLSICSTHKPTLNLCTHFCAHGVGRSCFSIQDRYSISAPPLHHCKVRWMAITNRTNAMHNLARIVRTALSTRCWDEDLMRQVPRLWNCLQQLPRSPNQDTRTSWKPFSPNPRGSGGVVLRAQGMEGMSSGERFSYWNRVNKTLPLETGGQVHTHTHTINRSLSPRPLLCTNGFFCRT